LNDDDVRHKHTKTNKVESLISWQPPPAEWILLNTDGAAKGNPGLLGLKGSLGGAMVIGFQVIPKVWAHALRHGLS